jgi:hypothetical protein
MYKYLLIALITAVFLPDSFGQVSHKDIVFEKTSIDLGPIYEEDGIVSTKYKFTNKGSEVFNITSMEAACGCTKPRASTKSIAPGKSASISLEFNPKGIHGEVEKWVFVRGNFSDEFQVKLNFSADISSRTNRDPGTYYKGEYGYLLTDKGKLDWGNKYKYSQFEDSIYMTNDGYNDIVIQKFEKVPAIVVGTNMPIVLKPGETKKLKLTLDASKMDTIGKVSDILRLVTTDKFYPTKEIAYGLTYNHDYRKLKKKQIKRGPKLSLSADVVDMGKMNGGGKMSKSITISNTGKSDLKILRLDTDCSCALLSPEKLIIPPNETITVDVTFDALYKKGSQTKKILMYTNDPLNAQKNIYIKAFVN